MKLEITSNEDLIKAIDGIQCFALWSETPQGKDWWEVRSCAIDELIPEYPEHREMEKSYCFEPPSSQKAAYAHSVAASLYKAFLWDTTKQGSDYWSEVACALDNYASNMLAYLGSKEFDYGRTYDEDSGEELK